MNSQRKRLPSPPWQYVATFISHCNALPAIKQCIDAGAAAAGALLPGSHRWSALGLVRSTPGVHYIATTKYTATPHGKYAKKQWTKCLSFVSTCFNAFYFVSWKWWSAFQFLAWLLIAKCSCWRHVTVCMYGMCLHKDVTVHCTCSLIIVHMDEGCAMQLDICVYQSVCVCDVCVCVCACVRVCMHVDLCIYWDRAACVAACASVCVSVGVGILRKHLPPSFFECTRGTLETWCNFIETWKFVLGNFDFQN